MLDRSAAAAVAIALAVALMVTSGVGVQASDDTKYPDWRGQWTRLVVLTMVAADAASTGIGYGAA